jgi:fused signal recognition particle receptor
MEPKAGVWSRLRATLARTQERLAERLGGALDRPAQLDDAIVAELEEALIAADLGVATTGLVIERLKERVRRHDLGSEGRLRELLAEEIARILADAPAPPSDIYPRATLVVGVNGAGKTTSIAKLARRDVAAGRKVVLAAADTFRAAAIEQLALWGERLGVEVIRHAAGSDPAAVVFDGVRAAKARAADHLIVDTAGRLHTKANLMAELAKVKRVIGRQCAGAPHEVLLVLDATTGQNGIAQARVFHEGLGLTGLVLTKLDGTAKGGIVIRIYRELGVPIKLVATGEKADDLATFDPAVYVDALVGA